VVNVEKVMVDQKSTRIINFLLQNAVHQDSI